MASSQAVDVAIINEAPGSLPLADVVFMPVNARGTRGPLNGWVLEALGATEDLLPSTIELAGGYALRPHDGRLLAFVVTVGNGQTETLLRNHLLAALEDERVRSRRSLWIPLMGTGAGKLADAASRDIIIQCLHKSGWAKRAGAEITIAGAPQQPPPADESDLPPSEGPAAVLPRSEALEELLRMAGRLRRVRRGTTDRLSTTLLFFALAESGSTEITPALAADPAARGFRSALQSLAGDRYGDVMREAFEADDLPTIGLPPRAPEPTANVRKVLRPSAPGGETVGVHDIIANLLALPGGAYRKSLAALGISAEELLDAYESERKQFVASVLMSDVAGATDRLDYGRYATAIVQFLTDSRTPPPLSISIQAPWGVGKSSLMQQIWHQLDPTGANLAAMPRATRPGQRLKLADVASFLDRRKKPAPPIEAADNASKLWTVWFNAWKYETSEQVWAGLVTAIVDQISDRLPVAERELFLLRLQLERIDDGIVRAKVHDRLLALGNTMLRRFGTWGAGILAVFFGVTAAGPDASKFTLLQLFQYHYAPGVASAVVLAGIAAYIWNRHSVRNEPAHFSLAEYLQVPPYNEAVGCIHRMHEDLLRVLALTPRLSTAAPRGSAEAGEDDLKAHTPIVIFIDDLDRCSPSKIARVVEGVSMLLASDLFRCFFVIGMDPQLIAAALESEHRDVIAKLPSYERAVPLGWRFMDKLIQLPFTIPPCRAETLEQFTEGFRSAAETKSGVASGETGTEAAAWPGAAAATGARTRIDHLLNGVARRLRRHVARSALAPAAPEDAARPVRNPDELPADTAPAQVSLAAAVKRDKEGRDLGELIQKLGETAAGNPRELKRMANLGRFYLQLRNARRDADPAWTPPSLHQYARWIALASRWPDAVRWLLWGTDEATWPAAGAKTPLAVRRLQALEDAARIASWSGEWQAIVHATLRVPVEDPSDWANDVKLFDYFRAEAALPKPDRISSAAANEFW